MDNNVFEAPESDLTIDETLNMEKADRGTRLGAVIIDSIVMIFLVVPIILFSEIFTSGIYFDGYLSEVLSGLLGIVVFALINYKLLVTNGQTIGKKALNIRIIDEQTGKLARGYSLLKRYGFYFFVVYIPFVGWIISLVNALFIFGDEKKCIHDKLANTIVVKT